jgi:NitT/TauT family transport system substrate-binding protein
MPIGQTRRRFLTTASMAGGTILLGAPPAPAAEGPLETTTLRFSRTPTICVAPVYVAEELLRAEGFADIGYVNLASSAEAPDALARGSIDLAAFFAPLSVSAVDRSQGITILAGIHVGCFELFGNDRVRRITDLKGKTVGVTGLNAADHMFVSVMAAHVGLDPVNEIRWITSQSPTPDALFADGKIDACLGLPPVGQDLRARHIGQVVVNSAMDRPWSQYFCCLLAGNRDWVQKHPVATKRALRAILKAADLCATDPPRTAQRLVDGGFTARYDYALQTLSELPYDKWREYDHEDTLRFYALRLREAGMVKASPQKIIADGADWRFLNDLKRELKV